MSKDPLPKTDIRAELKTLLLRLSFERRAVVLASGEKSDFYFDGKQTSLNARGAYLLGRILYDMTRALPRRVMAVGGPTLGADPLVSAVSLTSEIRGDPLHAFIIRKEPKKHGTGQWIEGIKNIKSGDPVAILEDVVTTGGSSLDAARKAREFGLDVVAVIAVVDREEGGAERIRAQGLHFTAVFTKTELLGS